MANIDFGTKGDRPWFKQYSKDVPGNIECEEFPLYKFLEKNAEKNPDDTALFFYDRKFTYREINELSDKFANALQKYGVKKGDRVLFLLPNCPQFLVGFYGAFKAGAVAIPLNPLYTAKELEYFFQDAEPRVVVTLDGFYEKMQKAAEITPQIEKIIVTNIADYFPPIKRVLGKVLGKVKTFPCGQAEKFVDFVNVEAKYNAVDLNPKKDLAIMIYTSGTTGTPKGAMLSHFNVASMVSGLHTWVKDGGEKLKTFLIVVPMFHVYGSCIALNWAISVGGGVVFFPQFHAAEIIKAIKKYCVNVFFGVPAMYSAFADYYKSNPKETPMDSLRMCTSGSAPIPDFLWKNVSKNMPNALLVESYGATENTGIATLDPFDKDYKKKTNSVGIPFIGCDIKIVDPETKEELPANTAGEFAFSGVQTFLGYWKDEEKTKKFLRDGWYYSNDIARMDEDGSIFVEGRLDDMINVRGEKVWPREIEKVVEDHAKVKEVAVVGIKDDYFGQKVKAYVVAEENDKVDEEEIKAFCLDKLVEYKIPKEVEIVKELPKSHIGKTLHYKLREKN